MIKEVDQVKQLVTHSFWKVLSQQKLLPICENLSLSLLLYEQLRASDMFLDTCAVVLTLFYSGPAVGKPFEHNCGRCEHALFD